MTERQLDHEPGALRREIERISGKIETQLIRAGEEAATLARRNPQSFSAQMLSGFVYHRQRNAERAIEALRRADRLRPGNNNVHFNLAMSYRHLGQLKRTLYHFQRAADLATDDNPLPAILSALYCHRLGDPERAISIFRHVLKHKPNEAHALYGLLQAFREVGAFDRADRAAQSLMRLFEVDRRLRYRVLELCQRHDFHGWIEIDDKVLLKRHVESYRHVAGLDAFDHTPDTFVMPDDIDAFVAAHRARPRTWITKPNNLHNGHGMRLFDVPSEAPKTNGWLVQEYVADPFLFLGRKVSFRIMMLITSVQPLRAYLFDGGSCRFAMMPYAGDGRNTWNDLPMHIGHKGRFIEQTDIIDETTQATGNDHHVWNWSMMKDYIVKAGHDPDALWKRIHRLARDAVGLIRHTGILEKQAAMGCRFGYGPKLIGFDILLDRNLKPWLLEIERGPDPRRLFDGQRENNPYLPQLMKMYVAPLLDDGRGSKAEVRALRDPARLTARMSEVELARRGRFIPLVGKGVHERSQKL